MAFNKSQEKFFHTKTGAAKLGKKNPPAGAPLPPPAAIAPMPAPTAPKFQDPMPTPFNPGMKSNWGGRKPI